MNSDDEHNPNIYKITYSKSDTYLMNRVFEILKILKKDKEIIILVDRKKAFECFEKVIEIIRIKRPNLNYIEQKI